MTQGPPCPNCGSLLRWYPDQQQWGCDKCRVMFPPQVMVQPSVYASQAQKRAARPLKWNKPVIFGVLAVLLAGAGLAITLLVIRRGKSHAHGYPDRDTAVKETFAALSAGNIDKIMAHADPHIAKFVTCEEGKAPTAADEAHDIEEMKKELERAIDRSKGATFGVRDVLEPDKPITKAAGEPLMRGCKLDTDIVAHKVRVKLDVTRGARAVESDATLTVTEIGGQFYVMTAPKLGGCDGAAAWITLVAGRDTDATLANKLATPILTSCTEDHWAAKVIECATNALGVKDEHSCLKDLEPAQRQHLASAITPMLDTSPAAATLRDMVPVEVIAPPTTNVTLGTPVAAGVADFWVTPRSDGSFLVTSPIVTAIFPTKPEVKVLPSSRPNADNKMFDIYSITAMPYELQLIAMGRNMRDQGGFKNLEAELGKLGTVTKADRTEDGQAITRFSITDKFTLDGRMDLARGLIINSTFNGALTPAAAAFLASVHVRTSLDPVDDLSSLTGVRQRKGLKGKTIVHDPDDHFTFELPFQGKVERKVDTDSHAVVVTIKKTKTVVEISELSAWDALALTPIKLGELTAKAKGKTKLVWNAFQHRLFKVTCGAEAPCDPIVKSFHFSDPEPPK